MVKKKIISKRYLNDGVSLLCLNETQQRLLKNFLGDKRIKHKTISHCPLCSGEDSIMIAEKDRYGIPLETVVCKNCGLVRSYKQLEEKSSGIFYFEYYRKIFGEPKELVDKRYEIGAKQKIPKHLTKGKTILDIGCGGGWNLMAFHNKGYKYYGFDFDQDLINYGRKRGLNLYLGGISEVIKQGIKCDYLVLDQVLEHTNNPIDFLISLKPILNDKAIIDIGVPALNLIFWGEANGDLLKILQIPHNFLFDEFTLEKIGLISGFEIVNCIGGSLVLKKQKNQQNNNKIFRTLNLNRGEKVVRYLRFVEKSLFLKQRTRINKILNKKLYCFLKPLKCWRKFSIFYLGRI